MDHASIPPSPAPLQPDLGYARDMTEVERVKTLEAELARKDEAIATLARLAVALGAARELDELLATLLDSLAGAFGFEHSMVLLRDAGRDVLVVAASRGYAHPGLGAEVPIGKGVIGVVAKRKKLMRLGGVATQRDYLGAAAAQEGAAAPASANPAAPSIALPGLPDAASVVAIPLVKQGELIGVFYVESTRPAVFDDADQALIEAVAGQAAVAIQNAQYHAAELEHVARLESANRSLTEWNASSRRFIPSEFLAILGRERLPEVVRGDHAELTMSTFFSDIRDYTSLVEGQGARENFAFINEYLGYMEGPITSHEGFVDSYRGDGILALFAGRADQAVRAAVESMQALARLNEAREARGDRPLRIGVGVDTGPLMLGTIGGEARLSAGVIGDSVNTACRIESLTKLYGASVLVTDRTRAGCAGVERFRMRAVDRIRPKGKANPITLYEVLDGLPAGKLDAKLASLAEFERGLELYQAGEPGAGLVHFAAALKIFPGDRAAQLYIGRCWQHIENGVPEAWDGVMTMTVK
jgi:adenylate cyclase